MMVLYVLHVISDALIYMSRHCIGSSTCTDSRPSTIVPILPTSCVTIRRLWAAALSKHSLKQALIERHLYDIFNTSHIQQAFGVDVVPWKCQ